ncbi:MAG: ABC transporter permease [Rickettsiaceae bacterium]|nr:ABC transporter permease [Rickettsiaceae bacterium]
MSLFNYYGTYILSIREIRRFIRVYNQTILAPVISALIFMSIFILALGETNKEIHGIPYLEFIAYGLISMTIIQNSFSNSSSSLIMARILGYVTDILMPPLDGAELVIALLVGSIARGIIVGILLAVCLFFIVDMSLCHPLLLILYTLVSCILLGNLGTFSALITDSFDQNSAITSYVITPLSFLSGTFYSVDSLPTWIKWINIVNPFFYIIDGFRFCFIDIADGNILAGFIYLSVIAIISTYLNIVTIDSGWKLKP